MRKIKTLFSFQGRLDRTPFWRLVLYCLVLVWLASVIDEHYVAPNLCNFNPEWICYLPGEVRDSTTLNEIVAVLLALLMIPSMVRRLHDHGKSGWWLLVALTGVGVFLLLFWFLTKRPKEATGT